MNNYLKLAKTSKQWPNSYSICTRFDDEFQRISAKLNETHELPDLSTPASTTTTNSVNKAAKQIITAISSFKNKDKFKSKSFIALNQTASPTLSNEKKTIESIEKQINHSLRQLEQAKLENSSRSLSTRNVSDTNNDDTKSFISDENNPSSIYRSRKLKTTLGTGTGSSSVNREAIVNAKPQTAKLARVVCSTLTLCDTASATITIPLPNFNTKAKSNITPNNPSRQATPGTTPPVVMQMVRPLDSTATNTDGSSDRGSASTNSLTRLPDEERVAEVPVGNSSTFNNFLKTVYFKNYNYTRYI